jgi:hypothetical protein
MLYEFRLEDAAARVALSADDDPEGARGVLEPLPPIARHGLGKKASASPMRSTERRGPGARLCHRRSSPCGTSCEEHVRDEIERFYTGAWLRGELARSAKVSIRCAANYGWWLCR